MFQISRIHQLTCNYIGHQDQSIAAICTRSECDKPSALCLKCILPFHKQCDGHITYLGDLSAKVSHFKSEILWIYDILESLIKQLRGIQMSYQNSLKPIQAYQEVPNMANLNSLGQIIRAQERIDKESIRIGNGLIVNLIETYLNPSKPKELTQQQLNEAEEWRQKSFNYYQTNEFQECIEKALSINSKSDIYWNQKANALTSLGKYQEAIQCYDAALNINQNDDLTWTNKGYALNRLGKYQEAIQCCDAALNINPKNDSAWTNKGNALTSLGKYQAAIQCYDAALNINQNDDLTWTNKGNALTSLGKYQEAIQCYDKSLNLKPSPITYFCKSFSLENLNKLKEAETCLTKALQLDSHYQEAKDRLKDIQAKLKK